MYTRSLTRAQDTPLRDHRPRPKPPDVACKPGPTWPHALTSAALGLVLALVLGTRLQARLDVCTVESCQKQAWVLVVLGLGFGVWWSHMHSPEGRGKRPCTEGPELIGARARVQGGQPRVHTCGPWTRVG